MFYLLSTLLISKRRVRRTVKVFLISDNEGNLRSLIFAEDEKCRASISTASIAAE
jgi:hypothetical protein